MALITTFEFTVKKDIIVLPKSVTPARIHSNLVDTLKVLPKLDSADIERLDGVAASGKQKRCVQSPTIVKKDILKIRLTDGNLKSLPVSPIFSIRFYVLLRG